MQCRRQVFVFLPSSLVPLWELRAVASNGMCSASAGFISRNWSGSSEQICIHALAACPDTHPIIHFCPWGASGHLHAPVASLRRSVGLESCLLENCVCTREFSVSMKTLNLKTVPAGNSTLCVCARSCVSVYPRMLNTTSWVMLDSARWEAGEKKSGSSLEEKRLAKEIFGQTPFLLLVGGKDYYLSGILMSF